MSDTEQPTAITYAQAGVDVEAGDKAVELMKASVRRATRPEVLGGLGGFAGMFDASAIARMTRPVLATSTDDDTLPWFRVVRADGSLAQGRRQRRLLRKEGIPFKGERVDMEVAQIPREVLADLV